MAGVVLQQGEDREKAIFQERTPFVDEEGRTLFSSKGGGCLFVKGGRALFVRGETQFVDDGGRML